METHLKKSSIALYNSIEGINEGSFTYSYVNLYGIVSRRESGCVS